MCECEKKRERKKKRESTSPCKILTQVSGVTLKTICAAYVSAIIMANLLNLTKKDKPALVFVVLDKGC